MSDSIYRGLLCVGDPHLASRVPGFRKDDYPRVILGKLKWSLDYARENALLPLILGDLFHYPRDNANWLLVELLEVLKQKVIAIAGNHDCNENTLTPDDTLSVLAAADYVHLLDRAGPWRGKISRTSITVGGTAWGQSLPKAAPDGVAPADGLPRLTFWLSHHDIRFGGYEDAGRYDCREIPGIDGVINGHIHRPLEDAVCGKTTWINPGHIARVSRSDGSRLRKPAVLRIDIDQGRWTRRMIDVPHAPFEDVFHAEVASPEIRVGDSLFVKGLAALEATNTAGGAGLAAFLQENLDQFQPAIADEIRALAKEVIQDAQ